MAVAVRLVEVLTLITILGILTGFSLFIVVVDKILVLSLYLLWVSHKFKQKTYI